MEYFFSTIRKKQKKRIIINKFKINRKSFNIIKIRITKFDLYYHFNIYYIFNL